MSRRDDLTRLRDMIEHAELAIDVAPGRSEQDLATDPHFRASCQYYVMVIGEAASHVSDETRGLVPDLPWREIIATRNIVVHGYAQVRADILWSILSAHLPELLESLRPIVDRTDEN